MGRRKIGAYLDSGSLSLFAQQICDAISGAHSVAIHDDDRQLVWAGPGQEGQKRWEEQNTTNLDFSGPGFCERIGKDECVYVFRLQDESGSERVGTIGVLADSAHPMNFDYAFAEVKKILACIERQLSINIELSSVRRVSEQDHENFKLLLKLDEIEAGANSEDVLQKVLQISVAHFKCSMAAVLLPDLSIREFYPDKIKSDRTISQPLMATLGRLFSAARKHKRVLLSDGNIKLSKADKQACNSGQLMCAPIMNSRDEVAGVLALLRNKAFPKRSARLARAICTKINVLTRTAQQLQNEHFSRHGFLDHLAGILLRHASSAHAMLYLDIDKLHVVNDSYGHMAGDEVIHNVIEVVDELTGNDDAVAHLSGDRIGIFLRDCNIKKAASKSELILSTLARRPVSYEGKNIEVSASIGIAMIPDVASDPSAALNIAEVAARSAKERGGNRYVVYQDNDQSVLQRRSDLDQVNHLQAALLDNRFVLYAQPIESLKDPDANLRFEILVRMIDETGRIVPPDKFLSAAERYQMMSALDRWVINNALEQIAAAENTVEVNLSNYAINVSAQSLTDDDFVDFVANRIMSCGIAPDSFCFEITETAVVRNLDRAQRFIRQLTKLGCRLALDDFGTGHCSFAYLKDLPVQFIKIDGVFVRDILENRLSESIVSSIASIAQVMNAWTIAEHVENELITQCLRQLDIDFVQGFAIGRPKPLADVLNAMWPPVVLREDAETSDLVVSG